MSFQQLDKKVDITLFYLLLSLYEATAMYELP